jgi:hypothetical protein
MYVSFFFVIFISRSRFGACVLKHVHLNANPQVEKKPIKSYNTVRLISLDFHFRSERFVSVRSFFRNDTGKARELPYKCVLRPIFDTSSVECFFEPFSLFGLLADSEAWERDRFNAVFGYSLSHFVFVIPRSNLGARATCQRMYALVSDVHMYIFTFK